MKRLALALVGLVGLATLVYPLRTAAQEVTVDDGVPRGFYLGGGVTDATPSVVGEDCWGYYYGCWSRDGESDTGWAVTAGWRFGRFVAVEAGYTDAGTPTWDDYLVYVPDLNGTYNVYADVDFRAADLTVVGILPFLRIWDVYLRGGLAYTEAESRQQLVDVATGRTVRRTVDDDGIDLVLGFGGGVTFAERVRVRLEYRLYTLDRDLLAEPAGDATMDVFDLQVLYRFGD